MKNLKNTKERCKEIRKRILDMSQRVGALHIGGSFSSVEIIDVIFNFFKKKMTHLFYQKDMLEFYNTQS